MTKKAASVFVQTLKNHGVDRFFCVPGESYLSVMDELLHSPGIDVVTCRHEGGAGFMAVADAKCTGKAGVAFVSRGPGATNASISVHSAHQGGIPMVLFIGQINRISTGKMHLQEMDFIKTFSDMAKHVEQINTPSEIANVTARAFHIAESGIPGPVVIAIPTDVLESKVEIADVKQIKINPPLAFPSKVKEVSDELYSAKRPVLVVGGQIHISDKARKLVQIVAEKYNLPVLCTYEHQDIFSHNHKHYAGELGLRPPEPIRQNALEADLVLVVGHRFNGVPNMAYKFPSPKQKFIHVLPDPNSIGKIFRTDLSIVADGENFLEQLSIIDGNKISSDKDEWVKLCHKRYLENDATKPPRNANDGLDFAHLIDSLGKLAPEDAIITNDAGNFTSWMHHRFPFKSSMKLIGSEIGAMGMGIPAGVAAALRYPNRQVFSIVGDGGALMTGSELATAVAQKAKIRVIIANNQHYGTIRYHQEVHFPTRNHYATNLVNPDFAKYGESFGLQCFTINEVEDIIPTIQKAMEVDGPSLIEFKMSLELNTSTTTISQLQIK
ncbi:thiamine pyrophosphate-binding protein [Alphaproteobacteria bacterium]|jgi:acetolactate synthase-1/2/3 large subunit|nr:thiamine pyrophosphate-binding protein [Alphaproteobacteria bacterium]MDC6452958.1 thiamine pyrophosphate-binding protein [Alphaproteobacteria bacterium]